MTNLRRHTGQIYIGGNRSREVKPITNLHVRCKTPKADKQLDVNIDHLGKVQQMITSTNLGEIAAISCGAGAYAAAGATMCTACPAGTISAAGATSCTDCPAGTIAAPTDIGGGIAAKSCNTCPAGTYSAAGAASCTDCVGQTCCCSTCPDGTTSKAGSASCYNVWPKWGSTVTITWPSGTAPGGGTLAEPNDGPPPGNTPYHAHSGTETYKWVGATEAITELATALGLWDFGGYTLGQEEGGDHWDCVNMTGAGGVCHNGCMMLYDKADLQWIIFNNECKPFFKIDGDATGVGKLHGQPNPNANAYYSTNRAATIAETNWVLSSAKITYSY